MQDWHDHLREYISFVRDRYGATDDDIMRAVLALPIPVEVFATELTPLQAAAHFLSQHRALDTNGIGRVLGRTTAETERLLSVKAPKLTASGSHHIDARLFSERSRSASEHVVFTLETQGLRVPEIARLLNKAEPTVWTLHYRIAKKTTGGDE